MPDKIGLFIPNLRGGGAQRVALNLAKGLCNHGTDVNIIVVKKKGLLAEKVSRKIRVINLNATRTLASIPKLVLHIWCTGYDSLISFMNYANICAVIASYLACRSHHLVLTEHTTVSQSFRNMNLRYSNLRRMLMRLSYPHANHVIAVSKGAAKDLEEFIGISNVCYIPNPISVDEISSIKKNRSLPHPWFEEAEPTILAAGRLTKPKSFSTLIRALSRIQSRGRSCRLIIIGEGEVRDDLETLIRNLDLEDTISLPGFVDNPYEFMREADVFALSSRWEGFGNVLVEAMACGTPVVSTDCPNGPAEILENGRWGHLVSVGDDRLLAQAILDTLDDPPVTPDRLVERAKDFSPEKIAEKYLGVINNGCT